MDKALVRITVKFIAMLLAAVLLYGLIALLLSAISVNNHFVAEKNDYVTVYLSTNGVHTDIVLPLKNDLFDWRKKFKRATDTTYTYAGFGWGDKGFYIETPNWSDLKFSTAFRALFYLSTSAMHVTYYKSIQESEHCKKINISHESYEQIVRFIDESFDKDSNRMYLEIPAQGYGGNDAFYEAQGSYSLFYTCNTWTNEALKSGELKACLWTPFDKPILRKYD